MTLTPTYEAIKRETSRKLSIKEKPAMFLGTENQCNLLPLIKRNIYEIVEMLYYDCIPSLSILFCYGICDSIIYIITVITYIFSDGKIHPLMCVNTHPLN